MMVLHHGGPKGHSGAVLIALAEKGLDHEGRAVDLACFAQNEADFLAFNPAGQVPVLEADGHRLTESFFILLYLDERFPDPPLDGADPRARYLAHKWGKYIETHLAPNLAVVAWAMRGTAPDAAARAGFERLTPERRRLWQQACVGFSDAEVAAARAAVAKALDRMAEDLADGPWLAGVDYGVADIALFPHVARARSLDFALPVPVAAWFDRVALRPRVREALGATDASDEIATMGPERGRWG